MQHPFIWQSTITTTEIEISMVPLEREKEVNKIVQFR
jgi:hypothetical protein